MQQNAAARAAKAVVLLAAALALSYDRIVFAEVARPSRASVLSDSRQWLALLHYRRRADGELRSEIDSEDFFLAPDGRSNPHSELQYSLDLMLPPGRPGERALICRFPARYDWLRKAASNRRSAPEALCPEVRRAVKDTSAAQLSLVFAESDLTNPASMFGHTFLKIGGTRRARGSELLAPTISFGAHTADERGVNFALKGLFGGYRGRFFQMPYYQQVKRYNDLERRSLWEYRLEFDAAEIRRLILHLQELRSAETPYFFIDENCSYQLLGLLEAARPELRLRERFSLTAVPAETVRAVLEAPDLLSAVQYIPSAQTRLYSADRQLSSADASWVEALSAGDLEAQELPQTLTRERRARVLEAAVELGYYREAAEEVLFALQHERSRIGGSSALSAPARPRRRPDEAQVGSRLGFFAGYEDSHGFVETAFRPAYHDRLDMPGGDVSSASLVFLDTRLRYLSDPGQLRLESLKLAQLESLPPRSMFVRPFSWRLEAGVDRFYFKSDQKKLAAEVAGAAGMSYELRPGTELSALVGADLIISGHFENDFEVTAGPELRLLRDMVPHRWRAEIELACGYLLLGSDELTYRFKLSQTVSLGMHQALRLSFSRAEQLSAAKDEVLIGWLYYF